MINYTPIISYSKKIFNNILAIFFEIMYNIKRQHSDEAKYVSASAILMGMHID
jgi:hypothetical protein